MTKTTKIIILLLGILLGSVALTIGLFLAIDINTYKPQIETLIGEQSGRKVHIDGQIQRSLFPWLGLKIGEVTIENASEFGDEPFAHIDGADVKIKVVPLFFGRLAVDTITLNGLALSLQRNEQGVGNWEDMLAQTPTTTPAPATVDSAPIATDNSLEKLAALTIGGIRVRNAAVSFSDDVAQQSYQVDQFNLEISEFKAGKPIVYELSFQFNSAAPKITGKISSNATFHFDLTKQVYNLRDFTLQLDAKGESLPDGKIDIQVASQLDFDQLKQQLSVSNMRIHTMGSLIIGAVNAHNIMQAPDFTADFQVKVENSNELAAKLNKWLAMSIKPALFDQLAMHLKVAGDLDADNVNIDTLVVNSPHFKLNSHGIIQNLQIDPQYTIDMRIDNLKPKALIQMAGIEAPETSEPQRLESAKFSMEIIGNSSQLKLKQLYAQLDKTIMKGQLAVSQFAQPIIQMALDIDKLNVDAYLPPQADSADTAPPSPSQNTQEAAPAENLAIALAPLRELNVKGGVTIKDLTVAGANLQDVSVTVKAKGGLVDIKPLRMGLYGGNNSANISLDVRGEQVRLNIADKIQSVRMGPLLEDVYGDDILSGTADAQLNIEGQGANVDAIMNSLKGTGNFALLDGVLKLDLEEFFTSSYNTYKKLTKKPRKELKKTAFEKFTGSFKMAKGIASNNDLFGKLRRYRITGEGKVNVAEQTLDYVAKTTVLASKDAAKDNPVAELEGHTIPTKITGPFSDPKVRPDFNALLKAEAKKALKKQQKKLEQKAKKSIEKEQEKLEEKTKESVDKEVDRLKEKLKKIF